MPSNDYLTKPASLQEAASLAFGFHYYRDCMNAATHGSPPKFSPITFSLGGALLAAGETSQALEHIRSHMGAYDLDGGR